MLYFIAYLLKGKAQKFHRQLVNELAEKFDVQYQKKKEIPSHITLKEPFGINNIDKIETIIEKFAKEHKKSNMTLEGFDHFEEKVLFMNLEADEKTLESISHLTQQLDLLLPKSKQPLHLHATIANRDVKNFNGIWKYLNQKYFKENPYKFNVKFDSVAILLHKNGKWVVHKEFKF